MSPLLISLIAFACIFGGTFLGIFIRYRLPERHLSGDTRDIVRQGTAVIATLASLVLGLLIASANAKFETQSSQVKQLIANIVLLDNILKLYGSDTSDLRALLRREIPVMADRIWRENTSSGKEQTFEAAYLGVPRTMRFSSLHRRLRHSTFFKTKPSIRSPISEKHACSCSPTRAGQFLPPSFSC